MKRIASFLLRVLPFGVAAHRIARSRSVANAQLAEIVLRPGW